MLSLSNCSERLWLFFLFFKQKTAYEMELWLEFRRVLFRSQPRASASFTYACVASGVRCADSTLTSRVMPSLSSVSMQPCMASRSESDPMRMATKGLVMVVYPKNSATEGTEGTEMKPVFPRFVFLSL